MVGACILTVVSAHVDAERGDDLAEAFRRLVQRPTPDGLLRSELLRGADGRWAVHTLWRDRAALDAMRASTDVPAAPRLFLDVGAEPSLEILELAAEAPG
jgi:heme-degrading monooxygenase HmoA